MKSSELILVGRPYGWDRKVFVNAADNFVGILTILKQTNYVPSEEKLNFWKKASPETARTIGFERYLFVSIDTGIGERLKRTVMLSQYLKMLDAANISIADGEAIPHLLKVKTHNGEMEIIAEKTIESDETITGNLPAIDNITIKELLQIAKSLVTTEEFLRLSKANKQTLYARVTELQG